MKIAFITTLELKSRASGVRRQAETWRDLLLAAGVQVEMVNAWDHHDWTTFDVLHVFGGGSWMPHFLDNARKERLCVVHSPMIDTAKNLILYRLIAALPTFGHRLLTMPSVHRYNNLHSSLCIVRSRDESRIASHGLGIPIEQISLVPICISTEPVSAVPVALPAGFETFCLHASQFTQERKNVVRLGEACGHLGLPLVVCGRPESEQEADTLEKRLQNHCRVHIMRFVSRGELTYMFKRCAVFALPSLYEGVGLSAMEAGFHGAEAVVSNVGGARDYFREYAHYAEPYSVSSIQAALSHALDRPLQPKLSEHIRTHHTEACTSAALLAAYSYARMKAAPQK